MLGVSATATMPAAKGYKRQGHDMLPRHSLPDHAGEGTVWQRVVAALTEKGEKREAQLIVQHEPEELACTHVQTVISLPLVLSLTAQGSLRARRCHGTPAGDGCWC